VRRKNLQLGGNDHGSFKSSKNAIPAIHGLQTSNAKGVWGIVFSYSDISINV
jgi:hypothetical protein